jgi:hypothetical protein
MIRLRGTPGGGGAALGTATVLGPPVGIPMLPARLIAEMQRRSRDSTFEPIDVVLVADRYAAAAGVTIPWGRIVGIVCEQANSVDSPGLPVVTGVPNLIQAVADDSLLLVDGDRGVVLLDPDSASIAAFQAERDRISPRRRFYLDFAHQPARTASGKAIPVIASVANPEEASRAAAAGADSLYLPESSNYLTADQEEPEQTDRLLQIAHAAVGKPLTIAGDLSTLSAHAMLRAALRMEVSMALPLSLRATGFAQTRETVEDARVDLTDQETDFGDIRIQGRAQRGEELEDDLSEFLVGRIIATGVGGANQLEEDWLEDLTAEAGSLLIPVLATIDTVDPDAVARLVKLGVSGLIVSPEDAQTAKGIVRQLE